MSDRDINELFDDIVLLEENLNKKGYDEGYAQGCKEGKEEGYRLGYAQGLQLGEELAEIYGTVVALLQTQHTKRVTRDLQHLQKLIVAFPRNNDPEIDIIEAIKEIRLLYKKLQISLGIKTSTAAANDLSF